MRLPDINFWLALVFQSHVHHLAAKEWFDAAASQNSCFCRWTQMGFLRLATNRRVFPDDALSMIDAWKAYDNLLSDERVVFVQEPENVEVAWRAVTQRQAFSTNVWSDAYLAALALMANLEIVSFDKGFRRYPNLRYTILS